jgi:hypothetical protein
MSLVFCSQLAVMLTLAASGGPAEPLGYDRQSGHWLLDPQASVSRNDTLYESPSIAPWEAMPVGGGSLRKQPN